MRKNVTRKQQLQNSKRRNALVASIAFVVVVVVLVSTLGKSSIKNESKKETTTVEVKLTAGIATTLKDADLENVDEILPKASKVGNDSEELKLAPTEVTKETPTEVQSYSEEDFYWLSHIIMAEVGDYSYENKLMCGLVVMNRVNDHSFSGETIKEVIFSPGQYETTWNGRIELDPNEESLRAAEEILSGTVEMEIPIDVVYQAQFVQGSGIYKTIGNEIYCYK